MLRTLSPFVGALLLAAATTTVFAQATPPSDADKAGRQERREKMKAAHQKALGACEGKKGQEHRDCMRTEMCAQSKDPAKCEARMKERAAKHREHMQDKK
jgi:hypothetical protein